MVFQVGLKLRLKSKVRRLGRHSLISSPMVSGTVLWRRVESTVAADQELALGAEDVLAPWDFSVIETNLF